MTLTVRMLPGGQPFGIRVPKTTAKTFLGRGIVATFDPPKVGDSYTEFAVYTGVPEASWLAYLAEEDSAERLKILATFGKPSPASSPVGIHESEFDSWCMASGDRMTASRLVASGVVAFAPVRKAATTPAAIESAVDSIFALLGRPIPAPISVDADADADADADPVTLPTRGHKVA